MVKQRIARSGQGKSGGYRTIVAFRHRHRLVFLWGFPKNRLENISPVQVKDFKALAQNVLDLSPSEVDSYLANGAYLEVKCHEQN